MPCFNGEWRSNSEKPRGGTALQGSCLNALDDLLVGPSSCLFHPFFGRTAPLRLTLQQLEETAWGAFRFAEMEQLSPSRNKDSNCTLGNGTQIDFNGSKIGQLDLQSGSSRLYQLNFWRPSGTVQTPASQLVRTSGGLDEWSDYHGRYIYKWGARGWVSIYSCS